jgi:hypothetical protein
MTHNDHLHNCVPGHGRVEHGVGSCYGFMNDEDFRDVS